MTDWHSHFQVAAIVFGCLAIACAVAAYRTPPMFNFMSLRGVAAWQEGKGLILLGPDYELKAVRKEPSHD